MAGNFDPARITLAPEFEWISSSKDSRATDISGLIDARVRDRNSVAYFCFTSLGRSLWISWSQIRTIRFSKDGEISSSSSIRSPWWVRGPFLALILSDVVHKVAPPSLERCNRLGGFEGPRLPGTVHAGAIVVVWDSKYLGLQLFSHLCV